ncbi:hypothetical protein FB645_001510 [Coemansia sp. IMI 203386]|nr:hypothetical protein FB645_001510 [Coemansia sp. IMI 203386]
MSSSSAVSLSLDGDKTKWNYIQEHLRDSVVAIQCTDAFFFDTEDAVSGNATGFVVDAELGLIVSNRHVMGPGPSYHKGVFFNNAEVSLQPCYYDPMHDFSIFRYDPAELKSFKPKAIALCPEKAYSGMEFRIVGNNMDEKMSVHPGELSQIDRNVVLYGEGYTDYNSFYIQASTTSNGGSSGSPVVNIDCEAVALMAGGYVSASSTYFLPLHRVVYALEFVKRNEVPPRGTVQAIFTHITHFDAEKRDLSKEMAIENGIDVDGTNGVLAVEKILPSGPADGKLKIGDIVVSINNKPIPGFVEMSDIVDSSVGNNIDFYIFRDNSFIHVEVAVQDLFSITPSKMLRVGGAYFHDMSFQLAARNSVPISGVYATTYYDSFMPFDQYDSCRIIYSVSGIPTPNLDALIKAFSSLNREQHVVLKLRSRDTVREEQVCLAKSPLVSLPDIIFTRSSATGFWSTEPFNGFLQSGDNTVDKTAAEPTELSAQNSKTSAIKKISQKVTLGKQAITESLSKTLNIITGNDASSLSKPNKIERKQNQNDVDFPSKLKKVAQCMVSIQISSISFADGSFTVTKSGNGLIVSKDHGIILCSTPLVSNPTCEIEVKFQGKVEIQATLAYSHPLYPISFLKYDPGLLKQKAGNLVISNLDLKHVQNADRLATGSPITVLSQSNNDGLQIVPSSVMSRGVLNTSDCSCCTIPRYYNVDYFSITTAPESKQGFIGVVCNSKGKVRGLWANVSFCDNEGINSFYGLDISVISHTMATLISGELQNFENLCVLNATYSKYLMIHAKAFGVSDQNIKVLNQIMPAGSQQIYVVQNILQKHASDVPSLQVGDVVLKVNGKFAQRLDQLYIFYNQKTVELTVIRDQKELTFVTPTLQLPTFNTRRVVCWAGIIMQEPWLPVQQKSAHVPSQVFSYTESPGSPARRKTQFNSYYVTEINNTAIKTLDDVVRIAKQLKSKDINAFNSRVASNKHFSSGEMPGCDAKVRIVSITGEERVVSIRTNDQYFPAWQLVRGPAIEDKWEMNTL